MKNLGIMLGGAAQGASQGLNLVNQYQQLRKEADAQQRQQQLAEGTAKLLETPDIVNDPIAFSTAMRDLSLQVGDPDKAFAYNQQIEVFRDAKVKKAGLEAFQLGRMDPVAAVAKMNEMYEGMGAADRLEAVRTASGGFQIKGATIGQTVLKDFQSMDDFMPWLTETLAPTLLGPEDAIKLPMEMRKTEAAIDASEAQTSAAEFQVQRGQELLPIEKDAARADIAQSQASAASSSASAALSRAQAIELGETRDTRMRRTQAETEAAEAEARQKAAELKEWEARAVDRTADAVSDRAYKDALAELARANAGYINAGKPKDNDVSAVLDELIPDPLPGTEGVMKVAPIADKKFMFPIVQGMVDLNGMSAESAAATAMTLLQVPNVKVDLQKDVVQLPNGEVKKLPPGGAAALMQARQEMGK